MIGIENGYSLGHDIDRLDAAYRRGARYLGLVHVGNNDLCTSSLPNEELHEPKVAATGISEFGRAAVRRANALGIMVDVSHASDACVRDVLAVSLAPIIASHSSARALVDHPRNLTDDLARAIAAKGGVDPGRRLQGIRQTGQRSRSRRKSAAEGRCADNPATTNSMARNTNTCRRTSTA